MWTITAGVPATLSAFTGFGDLNGCACIPELIHAQNPSSNPKPGGTVIYDVASTGAQFDPYAFAASLSASTGFLLPNGKFFPLDLDALFVLVVTGQLPTIFQNFQGVLDVAGQAKLTVNLPNIPALVGITYYTAGVTINTNAPGAIHLVTQKPVATTIQS